MISLQQEVIKKIFIPQTVYISLFSLGSRDENQNLGSLKSLNFAFYHPIAVLHVCHCALYGIREDVFCLTGHRLSAARWGSFPLKRKAPLSLNVNLGTYTPLMFRIDCRSHTSNLYQCFIRLRLENACFPKGASKKMEMYSRVAREIVVLPFSIHEVTVTWVRIRICSHSSSHSQIFYRTFTSLKRPNGDCFFNRKNCNAKCLFTNPTPTQHLARLLVAW